MDRKRIDSTVEAVCHKGCKRVWDDIEALEQGGDLPETRSLNDVERKAVLEELKTIMEVYSGTCAAN